MILDEDVLEQSGVKGMKWGQRRARDKAKLIGAGALAYQVPNVGLAALAKKTSHPISPLLSMGLSAAAAAAAVNVTRNVLNKKGNVKVPRRNVKAAKQHLKTSAKTNYLNSRIGATTP